MAAAAQTSSQEGVLEAAAGAAPLQMCAAAQTLTQQSLSFQLGAKKGLGAQKVSSKSFSEVEKQAQVAEKLREEQAAEAKKHAEESM